MPLELDLADPSFSPASASARASGDAPTLAERIVRPTLVATATPEFVQHPLMRHFPRHVAPPRAGDLHLWRFRCEWLPVPVQEGEAWLSKSERERARLHPNSALRKRFISARVVVRWIVAHLFGCEPRSVDLQDEGNEKIHARHPHDGRGITIDIAHGGIWIVIGIASAALGLGVVVPSPGALPDIGETPGRARRQARYSSLCHALRYVPVDIDEDLLSSAEPLCAFNLAEQGCWHVLDLPMGGKIRAAVTLAAPLRLVHTFGWPKGSVFA
jgi:hypothetical protein